MIDNYIFCGVWYAVYNYKFKSNSNTQHDGFYDMMNFILSCMKKNIDCHPRSINKWNFAGINFTVADHYSNNIYYNYNAGISHTTIYKKGKNDACVLISVLLFYNWYLDNIYFMIRRCVYFFDIHMGWYNKE